ncbi:hypothetical protein EMIHUDRAFT_100584 [Emiliania huxleyi CCMP1516]|uniref:Uncharacterized protein n=2 Tax=Emiliania huxleyi TaxID=2903 RepID=A0A0D3JSS0_EMIH1|nr:hypothetical protein EMIHUDRAFT_100584 [Emiliania huxleyi CCMP1516]EOD26555.1 hypothetical protein EMIHUDRAFT_100584 [Emiliania huxleyi CCMP1516]|eukprot:XP_005778984.1 hypothetical protein EMIHUDRAFT_100584 [Emiliania huxleyi CCMP1516]
MALAAEGRAARRRGAVGSAATVAASVVGRAGQETEARVAAVMEAATMALAAEGRARRRGAVGSAATAAASVVGRAGQETEARVAAVMGGGDNGVGGGGEGEAEGGGWVGGDSGGERGGASWPGDRGEGGGGDGGGDNGVGGGGEGEAEGGGGEDTTEDGGGEGDEGDGEGGATGGEKEEVGEAVEQDGRDEALGDEEMEVTNEEKEGEEAQMSDDEVEAEAEVEAQVEQEAAEEAAEEAEEAAMSEDEVEEVAPPLQSSAADADTLEGGDVQISAASGARLSIVAQRCPNLLPLVCMCLLPEHLPHQRALCPLHSFYATKRLVAAPVDGNEAALPELLLPHLRRVCPSAAIGGAAIQRIATRTATAHSGARSASPPSDSARGQRR